MAKAGSAYAYVQEQMPVAVELALMVGVLKSTICGFPLAQAITQAFWFCTAVPTRMSVCPGAIDPEPCTRNPWG